MCVHISTERERERETTGVCTAIIIRIVGIVRVTTIIIGLIILFNNIRCHCSSVANANVVLLLSFVSLFVLLLLVAIIARIIYHDKSKKNCNSSAIIC